MKSYYLILIILTYSVCQNFIETEQDDLPPINPDYFISDWIIYLTDDYHIPPQDDLKDGEYRSKGKGTTYYDWTMRSMIESWDTFCIPIFEVPTTEFGFPCKFLNTGEVSYLLVDTKVMPSRPECCIFSENFHPPTPSHARDAKMKYNSTITIDGDVADFYSLNIPLPGPFWYGWFRNRKVDGYRIPASFAFPTVPPEMYSIQNFKNFRREKPAPGTFDVPESCKKADKCIIFADK
jgi:hypothetical protein